VGGGEAGHDGGGQGVAGDIRALVDGVDVAEAAGQRAFGGQRAGQRSGMAPAVTAAPITGRIAWQPWFWSGSPSRAYIFGGYPTAGSRLHRASLPCPARATLTTCRPISAQRCG